MAELGTKRNILIRLAKAPFRVLAKARDFYVKSTGNFAGQYKDGIRSVEHGLPRTMSSIPSRSTNAEEDLRELIRASSKMLKRKGINDGVKRSMSSVPSRTANADEDLRELIKASSTKMLEMKGIVNDGVMRSMSAVPARSEKVVVGLRASSTKMLKTRGVVINRVMRTQSVGIGIEKIDEDEVCEFGSEFNEVEVCKFVFQ